MSNSNSILFVGGIAGKRKSDGKPFYLLHFGVPSDRETVLGYDHAQVFLPDKIGDKTAEVIYSDFEKYAKAGTCYPNIQLHYSRGGWDLISYKF